ncbi:MAG: serine hydrolase [Proteobacteria bacterium]|nr:serine hydrolase [Pseudomonadota bacterium]
MATTAAAAPGAPASFPDAAASDPAALGWRCGSPPPPERRIRFEDGDHLRFPQWRWSFSHWRELVPTVEVARDAARTSPLPRDEQPDLDAIRFEPLGGGAPVTWSASLAANYTDGIVVLHRGRLIYERYFGALAADGPHIAFSVTKSFFGTLAEALIHAGQLDPSAPVGTLVPELAASAFGAATVSQVLDMTTALDYSEVYDDPASGFWDYARATGLQPRDAGAAAARTTYEFLARLRALGPHGRAFAYRSVNTDVIGWLMSRAAGVPLAELLRDRLWAPLGPEGDAYLQVDADGIPLVAVGLNARLRDLARFGEMLRLEGTLDGRRVLPAAVIATIREGGSREAFAGAGYATLPGWSYRRQWWVSHDAHGSFMGRGIHGQALYVDPRAEMVIARFASHPLASNVHLDPLSLPAYGAVARHLIAHRP